MGFYIKKIKETLFSLRKIFFVYKAPASFFYYRYIVAPKIKRWKTSLEKPVTHENLSIHMLTCHRDALIALWSLASYYNVSEVIGRLTLHDDGTLTESDRALFRRLFPSIDIVPVRDFFERHAHELDAYPILKKFRTEYIKFQSKKLIDVYFERKGDMVLYLDSDMLWFGNPIEIHEAVLRGGQEVSYMMSNGKDRIHVHFKNGTQTTEFVAECNSGVTFFHTNNYQLQDVSAYIEKCDYVNRKFTDQACFGTVLKHVDILPRDKYFIKGTIENKDVVMRHYTGPSREKFYFYGLNFIYKDILSL